MHFKRTYRLGLSALALAALASLTACQSDTPQKQVMATGEGYQSPADVHYISDNQGNVARQLPVEMLKSIQADVAAQGQAGLAKELESLYDFKTGEVKDARAAGLAEAYLKSQLPANPEVKAPTGAPTVQELRPEDLPAGIKIPAELVEGLRKSAVEGGAR